MPFIKISGLTTATAVSATNQFEINQNGGSRSATVAQVAAFARTSATDPVVLPAGTVSAPALTFTGDTNTGIYSPAADTIAFTEGGVEAMRLDASGNVGIGTSSPVGRLSVNLASASGSVGAWDNTYATFGNAGSSFGKAVGIGFDSTSNFGEIRSVEPGVAWRDLYLRGASTNFYYQSGGGTSTLGMTLTATTGNIGVGTASPGRRLDVVDASRAANLEVGSFGAGATATQQVRIGYDTTGYGWVQAANFGTAATSLALNPVGGNVGIGTSSPSERLTVNSAIGVRGSNFASLSYFGSSVNTTGVYTGLDAGGGYVINVRDAGYQSFSTNNTLRMTIDSAGNMIMGNGAAADTSGRFFDIYNLGSSAGAYSIMRLITQEVASSNAATVDIVKYKNGTFALSNNDTNAATCTTFGVAGSERMRITSAGNVGIGTSSPNAKLDLYTNAAVGVAMNTGNSLNTWSFGVDSSGNSGIYSNGAYNIIFSNAATERMRIDASGNVGIGFSSPGTPLDVRFATNPPTDNGGGIHALRVYTNVAQAADVGGAVSFGGQVINSNNTGFGFGQIAGRKANSTSGDYAGYLSFATNTSGGSMVERMRITAAGNVGIGTGAPVARLQVEAGAGLTPFYARGANAGIYVDFAGTGGSYYDADLHVFRNGSTATEYMRINSSGSVGIGTSSPLARLDVAGSARLTNASYCALEMNSGSVQGQIAANQGGSVDVRAVSNHPLQFFTNNTERARITSGGDLLVGTTSATTSNGKVPKIYAYQTASQPTMAAYNNTTAATNQIAFFNPNGEVGVINTDGFNTVYATTSDYRLKENVTPLTGAAARVQALKPSRFNFIADPGRTIDGFIAHEAAEVVPEAVTGEKDAVNEDGSIKPQGIDQSKLVPLLTAALQEALAEITSLKARVAALENK